LTRRAWSKHFVAHDPNRHFQKYERWIQLFCQGLRRVTEIPSMYVPAIARHFERTRAARIGGRRRPRSSEARAARNFPPVSAASRICPQMATMKCPVTAGSSLRVPSSTACYLTQGRWQPVDTGRLPDPHTPSPDPRVRAFGGCDAPPGCVTPSKSCRTPTAQSAGAVRQQERGTGPGTAGGTVGNVTLRRSRHRAPDGHDRAIPHGHRHPPGHRPERGPGDE